MRNGCRETVIRSCALIGLLFAGCLVSALTPEEAEKALRASCAFFREHVAVHGGYVWQYSADLAKREGEAKALPQQVWVQPPGTPFVGAAFLDAYAATGDAYYLDAAKETAIALVKGQLVSGGWDYRIQFDPTKRSATAFRVDSPPGLHNVSTLDDNTTQSALTFLIKVDVAADKKMPEVRDAIDYGLARLIEAQYPNGAWPQRFDGPPDPAKFPVVKANYPETWDRAYTQRDYRHDYTFNDGGIEDCIDLFLLAHKTYGDARYRDAALRAGDFILLAQMPDPQPGWAQQYNAEMQPAWARKFEPPAICGGESQGVMKTLIALYHATGEQRYLEPLPRALAYYKSSVLPNGGLARFYELKTNKPLYFTKDYILTYESNDLPDHYGFIVGSALEQIEAAYNAAKANGPNLESKPEPVMEPDGLDKKAAAVIAALDERGAWVDQARLNYHGDDDPTREIIRSTTFVRNVRVLSAYIAEEKGVKNVD